MVLDLLLIGLGITLEPFPLIAFLLILSADKGTFKGLAFILGWLACLVVVIAAVVLLTGGKPPAPSTAPFTAVLAIKLALGVVLILYAVRQERRRGRPRKTPAWMARLDRLSAWSAAGLAAFLQPWTLVAAGAATVSQAKLSNAWGIPDPAAVLPAGHLELPLPGAVGDLPAGRGRRPHREAAALAGHPSGSGDHRDFPAAGVLAGRREPLPARHMISDQAVEEDVP